MYNCTEFQEIKFPDANILRFRYLVNYGGNVVDLMNDSQPVPCYKSSDDRIFAILQNRNKTFRPYPVDEIVAYTFNIDLPDNLKNSMINCIHINGKESCNVISNLKWVKDIEVWRTVEEPSIPNNRYIVSNWGRIIDTKTNTQPDMKVNSDNIRIVLLETENKTYEGYALHILVAKAFINKPDNSYTDVNIIDRNPSHLHYTNLEWIKHSTNKKLPFIKYSDKLLKKVCDTFDETDLGVNEASLFLNEVGVHMDGRFLRYLYNIRPKQNKFTQVYSEPDSNYVEEICKLLVETKLSPCEVCRLYKERHNINLDVNLVDIILKKKLWTNISDKYFSEKEI